MLSLSRPPRLLVPIVPRTRPLQPQRPPHRVQHPPPHARVLHRELPQPLPAVLFVTLRSVLSKQRAPRKRKRRKRNRLRLRQRRLATPLHDAAVISLA